MKHPFGILPVTVSAFLERFGFCILQGAIFKFAYSFNEHSSSGFYATYIALYFCLSVFRVFGGLLADTLFGSKLTALIGLGLGIMSCALFMAPVPGLTWVAAVLGALGSSFYAPVPLSLLSTLYRQRRSRHDVSVLILFAAMELGTILFSLVSLQFKTVFDAESGWLYLLGGAFYVLSALPLVIPNIGLDGQPYRANNKQAAGSPKPQVILTTLILLFLIFPIYEVCANLVDNTIINMENAFKHLMPEGMHASSLYYQYLVPIAAVILSLVFIGIGTSTRFPALLRIAIGFVCFLPAAFFSALFKTGLAGEEGTGLIILFFQLLPFSLVIPAIWAYISRHVPVRYNATLIAVFQATSMLVSVVMSNVLYRERPRGFFAMPRDVFEPFLLIVAFFFMIGAAILFFILNRRPANRTEDADNAADENGNDYKMASGIEYES